MKERFLRKLALTVCAALAAAVLAPAPRARAFGAPADTVKIGLYNNSTGAATYVSANLQNVTGCGSGYDFGYFDSGRNFVSLGAGTDMDRITVMVDRNMTYSASDNAYAEGTGGSAEVGCFHLQLGGSYGDYASAQAAAAAVTVMTTFVKYSDGAFYACVGSFTSSADADKAASFAGITDYTVTSGTSYTVTVVETGTATILFEFDSGASRSLAVMPRASGVKAQTWFKYYRYYGAFSYVRPSGGDITVVNYVNLEDYVKGVIPYEMSASWPVEALKAQAVSARNFVVANLNKHSSRGFDVCNTDDCQVYRGTGSASANSDSAVEGTTGQYLTYQGALCETYYFSSDGGATENSENVWSAALPYTRGIPDPYEAKIAGSVSDYHWTVTYTGAQLAAKLQARGYSCGTITAFEVTEFTQMGNVLKIRFTDENGKTFTFSKERTRTLLGFNSQRYTVSGGGSASGADIYANGSSASLGSTLSGLFAIGSGGTSALGGGSVYAITGSGSVVAVGGSSQAGSDSFTISGAGRGHNVGMSQWGAYSMAKYYNMSYDEILSFYYTGAEVTAS